MKTMKTYLTMALMALSTVMTMTSCDADEMKAWELSGSWTGYVETYYQDRFGFTGDNYRTTMYFDQRGSYGGTGYEVNYNVNSRYDNYKYYDFDWEVRNGIIYIYYADGWKSIIRDYTLNSSYFRGYMDDGTNRDIYFDLRYDGSFNWGDYRRGYWSRGANTRSADGKTYYGKGEFVKNENQEASE